MSETYTGTWAGKPAQITEGRLAAIKNEVQNLRLEMQTLRREVDDLTRERDALRIDVKNLEALVEKMDAAAEEWKSEAHCPTCQEPLGWCDGEWYCENPDCPYMKALEELEELEPKE